MANAGVALTLILTGLIVIGYLAVVGHMIARRRNALPRVPLWLEFEHCNQSFEDGVVTASGHIHWGGRSDKIDDFAREFLPPFEITISANGRDIEMMVTRMDVTMGSRDVRWSAQDKDSYVSQRTW